MTQIRSLLIGTALTAFAATGAFAQTNAQPDAGAAGQQMMAPGADTAAPAAQGVQPVTPAPQRLTASGSTDPLVQKRDADAKANAEYSASKKASKTQLKEQQADGQAEVQGTGPRRQDQQEGRQADRQQRDEDGHARPDAKPG